MKKRDDHDPPLPLVFSTATNDEWAPVPPSPRQRRGAELYRRLVDEKSRKLGLSRRKFMESACGAATALWVVNQLGCSQSSTTAKDMGPGACYDVPQGAMLDAGAAQARLDGDQFIFDVQTHHVNPAKSSSAFVLFFPWGQCGEPDPVDCFGVDHYVREIFVRSDTHVACLSGVPAAANNDPLTVEERLVTRETVDRLAGSQRLLVHASVYPNRGQGELDAMQKLVEDKKPVAAWKIYPSQGSWRVDDETIGIPFLEKARTTSVKLICSHRGISQDNGGWDDFSSPRDMGAAATRYPDLQFLVYHSGWEPSITEGPYNETNPRGADRLIKAYTGQQNLYAEMGSTWRGVMSDPTQAAHFLGKMLKHLGEDRILWGSDCIWYGSPQEQIAAFRAFQIPQQMQDQFGYPALTDEVKKKILGLNAARVYGVDPQALRCTIRNDDLSTLHEQARVEPPPRLGPLGPRTRREFFLLHRSKSTG